MRNGQENQTESGIDSLLIFTAPTGTEQRGETWESFLWYNNELANYQGRDGIDLRVIRSDGKKREGGGGKEEEGWHRNRHPNARCSFTSERRRRRNTCKAQWQVKVRRNRQRDQQKLSGMRTERTKRLWELFFANQQQFVRERTLVDRIIIYDWMTSSYELIFARV